MARPYELPERPVIRDRIALRVNLHTREQPVATGRPLLRGVNMHRHRQGHPPWRASLCHQDTGVVLRAGGLLMCHGWDACPTI